MRRTVFGQFFFFAPVQPEFKGVEYLGIYNPRKNEVARISVEDIPLETIEVVESEIICY